MGTLEIYVLSVGQGDTAIIKTPGDNIIVIDAYRPAKVKYLLDRVAPQGEIAHLIVTHPHKDHYSAVSGLLAAHAVRRVTLAPFWYEPGTAGYHSCINTILDKQIPIRFLSGYERYYPDGGRYPPDPNDLCIELLGPPNDILNDLHDSHSLNPNHLSVIARLTHGKFSMVLAADAQMENWAHYDREGMLEKKCDVLKAAHHGSMNGTQWERLDRLSPKLVIVSSDPATDHHLPDLIGSATFLKYDRSKTSRKVALTVKTGTIKITVDRPLSSRRRYKTVCYGDGPKDRAIPQQKHPLPRTDWLTIVQSKVQE